MNKKQAAFKTNATALHTRLEELQVWGHFKLTAVCVCVCVSDLVLYVISVITTHFPGACAFE